MKVIDLLNKIANGEEVPKKIKIYNTIYEYRGYMYCTENANCQDIEDYLFGKWNFNILNERVEIIEDTPKVQVEMTQEEYNKYLDRKLNTPKEDKRIEKIKDYRIFKTMGLDCKYIESKEPKNYSLEEKEIVDKINEIIDKINDKDTSKKIEQIGKSYDIKIYSPEDDTYNYDLNKLIDMVQDIYDKQSEIIDRLNGE